MAHSAISGIKAAHMEKAGEGALSCEGKSVVFRNTRGSEIARWWLKTEKEAATNLRIFRAALKYETTHV